MTRVLPTVSLSAPAAAAPAHRETYRRREQRRGLGVDREIDRDLGNDRIDRAREQRRGKDHEADNFENGWNGAL